jgi:hypothetical protein
MTEEEKKKKEEDDKKAEEAKKNEKSEMQLVLDAIKGVETSLTAKVEDVAKKVDDVVKEQSEFKSALDGVTKKAETLEGTLKGTVVAQPKPEDRPAGVTLVKKDDDPRTGCFDTAFMGRSRSGRR